MKKGPEHSPFLAEYKRGRAFAESTHCMALYNIAPILPGHSLVAPKRYVESLLALSDEELVDWMRFGKQVVLQLQRAFQTTGFDWTIQEGEEAGQTVAHLHMHIIPRKPKDLEQPGDWYEKLIVDSQARPRLTSAELDEMVEYLRRFA